MKSEPIFRRAGKPKADAPNIVTIMLDDTGFAQLGAFGSTIATPNIDRLALGGLSYNRFHVTALCSPSRASFLTGRNHHAVGMGFVADLPLEAHGHTARIPRSAATLPRILRDAGFATLAVGKWHLTPRYERSAAGPFTHWPLGQGFERYYGFLLGDANQYAPHLVEDNHYVEPPATPEEGYHLSEDITDKAIRYLDDLAYAAPGKPFFLYYALGAMHSPHQVAPKWVKPYHGTFDQGWDRWREEIFERQLRLGVVPAGTTLTERPQWVEAWDSLSEDRRRMYARQQEVFAGFLTHTDAQIGRLLDHLAATDRLDNTIVVLTSDNGASAEGGLEGSYNEHRFTSQTRESLEDNLAHYDDWGGLSTYNHYSWGWAWAGNTPFKLWKRYTWLGGTRTPLIVHWPAGMTARGELRETMLHIADVMPTLLDAAGVIAPEEVDGVEQQVIDGASFRATFDDPTVPGRETQYFEMLGSRSLIHGRWKTTTNHISKGVLDEEERLIGSADYAEDHWALYDLESDFSEAHDIAEQHPEVVAELQRRWDEEAERNHVRPLFDGLLARMSEDIIWPAWPPQGDFTCRPGASPINDESVPMLFGPFRLTADIEVPEGASGVLFAIGDRFGGYALYVVDGRLGFAFARPADHLELIATEPLALGRQKVGVWHTTGAGGSTFHLVQDEDVVASLDFTGMLPFVLQHGGTSLRLGHDTGIPVTDGYTIPAHWNGVLHTVRFQTTGDMLPDPIDEVRSALHAD